MPTTPPSFGAQEYWDQRFRSNPNPFEWLEAPTSLDPYIVDALKASDDTEPQLLHIGCGTSLLSYHLRAHVRNPEHIHNVDYSKVAIQAGKKREKDIFNANAQEPADSVRNHDTIYGGTGTKANTETSGAFKRNSSLPDTVGVQSEAYMKWSSANLLDYKSLLGVCQPSKYSLVIDKSTSDSIACSDDLYVPLPYHITTSSKRLSGIALAESSEPIHPLHIMAIHLALIVKPRARWISLSYSADRYPFLHDAWSHHRPLTVEQTATSTLGSNSISREGSERVNMTLDDDLDSIPRNMITSGLFPNPSALWKLIGKYSVEAPMPSEASGDDGVHRPKVMHWVYILERTEVPLLVRN